MSFRQHFWHVLVAVVKEFIKKWLDKKNTG